MSTQYDILIRKLRKFIRKYYANKLLRGVLYFISVFLAFYLFMNLLEYAAYFNSLTRTILFYAYTALNLLIFIYYIIIPLFRMFRITRTITEEQAALLIGRHFPEVQDKLLNTIQLRKIAENTKERSLVEASIEQKTRELRPVPFSDAIDLRSNAKYLKYALPLLLILVLILLTSPHLITEPSYRMVHYKDHFERELPYELHILNNDLTAIQQDNYKLKVKAEGTQLPSGIHIEFNGGKFRMSRENPNIFTYSFMNVQQDIDFWLETKDHLSKKHTLRVLPKPIILHFECILDYPEYTGKKDEIIQNNGDLVIPEGSHVSWKFYTRDATKVFMRFNDTVEQLHKGSGNTLTHERQLFDPQRYSISVANAFLTNSDSLQYNINTIPDIYPSIIVEEFRDSSIVNALYFRGLIKDDYGFDRLNFCYSLLNRRPDGELPEQISNAIPISRDAMQQQFFHHFDLTDIEIRPGEELEYYFEVWDNDGIHGSKMTRSEKMYYKVPTREEITESSERSGRKIKEDLEQSISEAGILKEQIEKMQQKLVDKENLSWDDRQQVQNLLDQQKDLGNKIDRIRKENLEKSKKEEQFKDVNEEILEKQQKLEALFDEIMSDEIKELFEEMQKLLDEVDKDKVSEMLRKMDRNTEQMSEELDKSLEWFKQLEFDKKLTETIDQLKEMAKDQDALSEESEEKSSDAGQLSEEQEKLNEAFAKFREDYDTLEKMNQELEQPNSLLNSDSTENSIQDDMQQSLDLLMQNKKRKASGSQKDASKKMEELSEMLFDMQQMMNQQSAAEDAHTLRGILENLVQLSFDQEALMEKVTQTHVNDPNFPKLMQRQKKIGDDLQIVEDSLVALSKRQMTIQPFVAKEIDHINTHVGQSLDLLNERKRPQAASKQQYIMTSINNLALLLSEVLQQMQQNMNMQSSSSCPNSNMQNQGQGKPSMSELQKQLNKQLQQMKDGTGQEKMQGKKGAQSMSEQLARMAAQQEAIRRQLQEYLEQLKKEGASGDASVNKLMEEMEKTEMDIVSKQITKETLKRQEDIVTRLLEHEKAQREREKEERRESREAKSQKISNPEDWIEYNSIRSKEAELLRTVPPKLRPFYKEKVTQYFYQFME